MNINNLRLLKFRLLGMKPKYLSIKEIQEIMRKGEYMPTAIFSVEYKDYIVKPRTVYAKKTKRRAKGKIRI